MATRTAREATIDQDVFDLIKLKSVFQQASDEQGSGDDPTADFRRVMSLKDVVNCIGDLLITQTDPDGRLLSDEWLAATKSAINNATFSAQAAIGVNDPNWERLNSARRSCLELARLLCESSQEHIDQEQSVPTIDHEAYVAELASPLVEAIPAAAVNVAVAEPTLATSPISPHAGADGMDKEAMAIATLTQNPKWSKKRIAAFIGCSYGYLKSYETYPKFQTAWKVNKEQQKKERQGRVRRGFKTDGVADSPGGEEVDTDEIDRRNGWSGKK